MQNKYNPKRIRIIIGLGNPGKEYENTPHNAGLLFIEELANELKKKGTELIWKKNTRPQYVYAKVNSIVLIKSGVYMNTSGEVTKEALAKWGVNPEETMIAHDEHDLETTSYRLNFGSGPAGHKGIISITNALTTKNYWRLRIGTKDPDNPNKAGDTALEPMTPTKRALLTSAFKKAIQELGL